jgi:DNA-binding NtrC family response regulator
VAENRKFLRGVDKKDIILDNELVDCEKNRNITPEQLKQTVENCYWNKTKAAIKMGRSRRQIYRLLEKYEMVDYIKRNFLL